MKSLISISLLSLGGNTVHLPPSRLTGGVSSFRRLSLSRRIMSTERRRLCDWPLYSDNPQHRRRCCLSALTVASRTVHGICSTPYAPPSARLGASRRFLPKVVIGEKAGAIGIRRCCSQKLTYLLGW
ncbi:uncharacterized protein LOC125208979 [Salvia hispanica]|uniref:uncharacterized protein LOC125208979 n=1 Tax=Salvia hispanica TaxID=49212 RepID=UPI0020092CBA|nr:uncharacterized protein LOC125208979 [Salvia hispanica]